MALRGPCGGSLRRGGVQPCAAMMGGRGDSRSMMGGRGQDQDPHLEGSTSSGARIAKTSPGSTEDPNQLANKDSSNSCLGGCRGLRSHDITGGPRPPK